jgi:uncharacterized HAD superfamily protein
VKKRLTICVDFDGTIVQEEFPYFGELNLHIVDFMKQAKEQGHLIIVWTARSGKSLEECEKFLKKHNVQYDYINENPEDEWFIKGEQGRKLLADYYIDDRVINVVDVDRIDNILKGE